MKDDLLDFKIQVIDDILASGNNQLIIQKEDNKVKITACCYPFKGDTTALFAEGSCIAEAIQDLCTASRKDIDSIGNPIT